MGNPFAIRINGEEFVDFRQGTVAYSLESFARTFAFEFSDKWLRSRIRDLPFAEGDPCEVLVHGQQVIDGFLDDVPIEYSGTTHSISVTGRSWNGHMVDSSAVHKGGSWRNAKLLDIAKAIAEPYGVGVKVDPWAMASIQEPFPRWAIEDEETAFECIRRAAEMRGVFLVSDAGRNIVITKAAPTVHPAALVFGQNILRARRSGRFTERHSYYLVKSQHAGSDTWYAKDAAGPFIRVDDPQVTSFRPLIVVSDGSGSKKELELRAAHERNVRAGRSRRITYTVTGHKSPAGRAWPINERIAVQDPFLDCQDALLVAGVTLEYGDAGETADIELARPEAFDVLIPPTKPNRRKGFMSLL